MTDPKLDNQIQTFLARCARHYPEQFDGIEGTQCSVELERRCYASLCAEFDSPCPEDVTSTDAAVPGRHGAIPVRRYRPSATEHAGIVMYLHGGGFILGDLNSHHSICADIAHRCGCEVVAVAYRLAPENRFPVQFEDVQDAFAQLDCGTTIVCGDSAGGNLAAALCLAQRGQPRQPCAQVLIYPALGGQALDLAAYETNSDAPGLTAAGMMRYLDFLSPRPWPWHDERFAPIMSADFSDLPPCTAVAAEFDPLADDARVYAYKLTMAGVPAACIVEPGLIHGYLRARHCSDKAGDAFSRICHAIAGHFEAVQGGSE